MGRKSSAKWKKRAGEFGVPVFRIKAIFKRFNQWPVQKLNKMTGLKEQVSVRTVLKDYREEVISRERS